jgi:CMP-N-acetylneuraminic acid synthetase
MCKVEFLENNLSFLNKDSVPIIFSKKSSFDIDDEFDLELARNAT